MRTVRVGGWSRMKRRKKATNLTLSQGAKAVLSKLKPLYGLSQSSIVETLIREKAKEYGIKIPDGGSTPESEET